MPILFITDEWEYAIAFPKKIQGIEPIAEKTQLEKKIQVRKRVFSPDLSASFDIGGVDAVVIGTPFALKKSPESWVLTAIHEMFHVLQASRGRMQKVRSLNLGSETDASRQLNFPFPYADEDVLRLIHLQSYPIYLGITDTLEANAKYNSGVALEAIKVYQNYLKKMSGNGKFYSYLSFRSGTKVELVTPNTKWRRRRQLPAISRLKPLSKQETSKVTDSYGRAIKLNCSHQTCRKSCTK